MSPEATVASVLITLTVAVVLFVGYLAFTYEITLYGGMIFVGVFGASFYWFCLKALFTGYCCMLCDRDYVIRLVNAIFLDGKYQCIFNFDDLRIFFFS